MGRVDDPDVASAKAELREELLTARRARTVEELAAARAAIRGHVLGHVDSDCVAAYEPLRTEPGSVELLAELAARGVRVLVPVTRPDRDLDWAPWTAAGRGASIGMTAVASAGLVLVPALAVAPDGTRLGRGGGSYDRALHRLPDSAVTVALVFHDELRPDLPRDPWDVPVAAAVTPEGWVDLRGNSRGDSRGNPDFPSAR